MTASHIKKVRQNNPKFSSPQAKQQTALTAIQKKLTGGRLTYRDIYAIMDEISKNRLGTVLTTYFAASGYSKEFSDQELYYLTKAMVETGKTLSFKGVVADKHSMGGIPGTRVTMIIVPIIASLGIKTPCTPSRAITTPAGTADDMEVLCPVTFSVKQIQSLVNRVGACIVWGGGVNLAPADDELINVERPLFHESFDKIIVSIMAKKIAAGNTHVLIEIPLGRHMKFKHRRDAEEAARKFIKIGRLFNLKIKPTIIPTLEPAGQGIGPHLEVRDVLRVLQQKANRSKDLEERSLTLAAELLDLCRQDKDIEKLFPPSAEKPASYTIVQSLLKSGQAWQKMQQIISAQGGQPEIDSEAFLPAKFARRRRASRAGRITEINSKALSAVARILGAPADRSAGINLHTKLGNRVKLGQTLFTLYSSDKIKLVEALDTLEYLPAYSVK